MGIRSLSAVLVCLLGAAASSQPNEKRFTLRGRAVDAQTGQPLANLRITLDETDWNRAFEPAITGPDGRFLFRGLENHEYALGTVYHGETIQYREAPDTRGFLTVAPNDEGPEIEFRVASHPSVSGIVRDEFGDPLLRAEVAVFRPVWRNGLIVYIQEKAATTTDDRGWYRIRDIWPGSYFLCASEPPHPGMGRELAPVSGEVDFLSRQSRVYRRTCHPGPPPSLFQLAAGQNAGVDIVLSSVSGLTLRGRVSNMPPGFPTVASLRRNDLSGGSQRTHQVLVVDGSFALDGIEPGHYLLTVEAFATMPVVAKQTVEVKDTDIDSIGLTLEAPGAIELAVHRTDGTPAGSNDIVVGLRPVGQTESVFLMTDSSGSRRFLRLNPDAYWVTARTTAPYCVQSVRFGAAAEEVLQRTLTVTPGMKAQLDVTLTTECSSVVGRVVAGNKPVPAKVVLLISGTTGSPGDIFELATNVRGEFTVNLLPPGRYQVWAWSEGRGFLGPSSLADVADKASVVVVGRGQKGAVVVQSLNPEGEAK